MRILKRQFLKYQATNDPRDLAIAGQMALGIQEGLEEKTRQEEIKKSNEGKKC